MSISSLNHSHIGKELVRIKPEMGDEGFCFDCVVLNQGRLVDVSSISVVVNIDGKETILPNDGNWLLFVDYQIRVKQTFALAMMAFNLK